MVQESRFSRFLARNLLWVFFLGCGIFVLLPGVFHAIDKGKQIIDLDAVCNDAQDFGSRNVTFTGHLLLDSMVIEEESKIGRKGSEMTRYIVPLTADRPIPGQQVCCFLIWEFGPTFESRRERKELDALLHRTEGMKLTLSGTAMNFLYVVYTEELSEHAKYRFKKKLGLAISESPLLIKMDYTASQTSALVGVIVCLLLIAVIGMSYRQIMILGH